MFILTLTVFVAAHIKFVLLIKNCNFLMLTFLENFNFWSLTDFEQSYFSLQSCPLFFVDIREYLHFYWKFIEGFYLFLLHLLENVFFILHTLLKCSFLEYLHFYWKFIESLYLFLLHLLENVFFILHTR